MSRVTNRMRKQLHNKVVAVRPKAQHVPLRPRLPFVTSRVSAQRDNLQRKHLSLYPVATRRALLPQRVTAVRRRLQRPQLLVTRRLPLLPAAVRKLLLSRSRLQTVNLRPAYRRV